MFLNTLSKSKIAIKPLAIIGVVVLVSVLLIASETQGWDVTSIAKDAILGALGWVTQTIVKLLGGILGLVIDMLVAIAQYNHFTDSAAPPAIHIGWGVVRDFSNMLFIIGLMIIAFGTILKIQSYHARNALVKLIIMAVLINFSKTITGVLIDFAQVVMMTFVDAFKDSAPIVMTVSFNIQKMMTYAKSADSAEISLMSTVASMILSVALIIVAITVVFAMCAVLLARILMLWVLVILAPIAYIATVLPNTQRYASSWWSSLGKNLLSGPLLAFFLWLALSIISTSSAQPITLNSPSAGAPLGQAEIMTTQNMFNFIITIALLIMGLMMTQSLGVMGGSFAGSMVGRLKTGNLPVIRQAMRAAKAGGVWTAKRIDDLQAKGQQRFARTSLAKSIASGKPLKWVGGKWVSKRFDLEGARTKLEEHGVQARAIAPAWKARAAKKEEQRLGESVSVGQDIMNRLIPLIPTGGFKPEKTDYTTLARAARSHKAQSEIEAGGEEQELLTYRLENEFSNKDGSIRQDKIAEGEATMRILLSNHDINEWMKRPFFADIMKQYNRGSGKVTQKDLIIALKHMFGDTRDSLRIAQNLEEGGLLKNDAWVKGITEWDDADKRFKWTEPLDPTEDWQQDAAAKRSALYNAKKTGRTYANSQRRQNFFTERADDEGDIMFRELHNVGKWNLKTGVDSLLSCKLEHYQPEFLNDLQQNLDLIVEWQHQADNGLSDTELDKLQRLIAKVAGGAVGKENEMEALVKRVHDTSNPKDAATAKKELNDIIIKAIESKQDKAFWENIHNVNTERHARGWDKGDSYKVDKDEQIYKQVEQTGATQGVNHRIDRLRHPVSAGPTPPPAPAEGQPPSPEGGESQGTTVIKEGSDAVENIQNSNPAKFGTVPPEHFKKVMDDFAAAFTNINTSGGLDKDTFAKTLSDSIDKLREALGHLPKDLQGTMSAFLNNMKLAATEGKFEKLEEQRKVYNLLKNIPKALEEKQKDKEKKDTGDETA